MPRTTNPKIAEFWGPEDPWEAEVDKLLTELPAWLEAHGCAAEAAAVDRIWRTAVAPGQALDQSYTVLQSLNIEGVREFLQRLQALIDDDS